LAASSHFAPPPPPRGAGREAGLIAENPLRTATATQIDANPIKKPVKFSLGSAADASIAMIRKAATWEHTLSRMSVSVIVTLFLVHSTTTRASLSLFSCMDVQRAEVDEGMPAATRPGSAETLDEGRLAQSDALTGEPISEAFTRDPSSSRAVTGAFLIQSYQPTPARNLLVLDLDVDCQTPQASLFMTFVGAPAFFLYAVGIPAIAAYIIFHNRARLEDDDIRRVLGFLYAGYKVPYWESVVMVRVGTEAVAFSKRAARRGIRGNLGGECGMVTLGTAVEMCRV
jgi:hypothetical protein